MNQREHNSMVAIKNMIDAYYDLPLSVRDKAEETMRPALNMGKSALKEYSAEVRGEIVEAVKQGNVHRYITKDNQNAPHWTEEDKQGLVKSIYSKRG
jgi:hypothetical protein